KTRRFMEENGLQDFVVNVEEATKTNLQALWSRLWAERNKLHDQYAAIRQRETGLAHQHTQLLFNKIKSR
ncbi:MAG: hypothetical protein KAH24_07865, partial [Holophagae bacterium]|nr:hypothetical protein [Holophagae bacterium]